MDFIKNKIKSIFYVKEEVILTEYPDGQVLTGEVEVNRFKKFFNYANNNDNMQTIGNLNLRICRNNVNDYESIIEEFAESEEKQDEYLYTVDGVYVGPDYYWSGLHV